MIDNHLKIQLEKATLDLDKTADVEGILIIASDGRILHHNLRVDVDINLFGPMSQVISNSSRRLLNSSGQGEMERVLVESSGGKALFLGLNKAHLIILMQDTANVGLILVHAKRASQKIDEATQDLVLEVPEEMPEKAPEVPEEAPEEILEEIPEKVPEEVPGEILEVTEEIIEEIPEIPVEEIPVEEIPVEEMTEAEELPVDMPVTEEVVSEEVKDISSEIGEEIKADELSVDIQKSAEELTEELLEKPVEEPAEELTEELLEKPVEEPAEEFTEELSEEPVVSEEHVAGFAVTTQSEAETEGEVGIAEIGELKEVETEVEKEPETIETELELAPTVEDVEEGPEEVKPSIPTVKPPISFPKLPDHVEVPDDPEKRSDLILDIYEMIFLAMSMGAAKIMGVAPARGLTKQFLPFEKCQRLLQNVDLKSNATIDFAQIRENSAEIPVEEREEIFIRDFSRMIEIITENYGRVMGYEAFRGMVRAEFLAIKKSYGDAMDQLQVKQNMHPEIALLFS